MSVRQAVILAGGEGTRLRPLTNERSKAAVPLLNEPLISHHLRHLARLDITDIIVTLCYLPETVRNAVGDGHRYAVEIEYVVEREPLGTAGALKNVESGLDDLFVVINGDDLMDVDYSAMARVHANVAAEASIALYEVADPSQYGLVQRDDTGRVTAFLEKQAQPPPGRHAINAGAYVLGREVLDLVPAGRACSIEYDVFPRLIADGARVQGFVHRGYWIDVGKPDAYLQAHRDAMNGAAGKFSAPQSVISADDVRADAHVKGPVCLGANVRLADGAHVGPNACVGRNCSIGRGARVEESVLWDDVTVGAGARLSGCIVCSGVDIGDGVSIGPGTVIAAGSVLR